MTSTAARAPQSGVPPAGEARRPVGVAILAGLAAFRGVVGLWASVAVVGVLNSLASGDVAVLNLAWLAIAVVFLALAFGAWSLKRWAWPLGVGVTGGSMLLEVFGVLAEGQSLAGTLISVAISAALLFLLSRPDVKAAFRRD